MCQTRIGRFGAGLAVLLLLLPVSLSADDSPPCHQWEWDPSIDAGPTEDTTEEPFHPFYSLATAADVTRCLDAGADPNSRTTEGGTPLHFAALFSDTATVILALLEAGADLHARSEDGDTPLHFAAIYNSSLDVIHTLLRAGADVNARGQERATPLHYAAFRNPNASIIDALLQSGSDPNARMEYGETPLHAAAALNGNPAVLVALLDGGADPIARDDDDQTPWDYARENESLKGTTAYWCLNDVRWRAMESETNKEPLPSWCRLLVSEEENSPSSEESQEPNGYQIQDNKLWLSDDGLPASFAQHKDWIESCTELPVLVVSRDLVLYSIDVEDGLESIAHCLLSKAHRVETQSSSDVGAVTMYLPPFANSNGPIDGRPQIVPEALIRTEGGVLIISGRHGDFGLEYVQRVSENSLVAQIGWGMTHTRVYHVIANKPESVYVTNGDIVDIWDGKNGCFLIVVEDHKRYFSGGGAFWLDGVVDCEGNILDIYTLTSDCMSVEELSDKSGLDLSRVRRKEVCIST